MSSGTTLVVDTVCSDEFVNKVLDLKLSLKGRRAPTRYELRQLMKRVPKDLTEEIQQMFNGYAKGLDYRDH